MGVLHSVSSLGFCAMSRVGANYWAMAATIGVESFCVGLTTAGFAAFLMDRCDARYSATQYAVLSGLVALSRTVCAMPGGYIAERTGWPVFFAISAAAGIPGVALLPWLSAEGEGISDEMRWRPNDRDGKMSDVETGHVALIPVVSDLAEKT
jgi:PAT family beta-lactamase induction signal transducer AmpG